MGSDSLGKTKKRTGWPWDKEGSSMPETMANGSSWPRISIVTPSYNQVDFLEETIRSVLLQGYPNLEYMVIDGGSCDGSVEIIKKYEKDLAYWVSEPDDGQAHAIRKGFEKSTGDFQAWINSDDVYSPGTLQKIAEAFTLSGADVVYGHEYFIDEKSKKVGERLSLPFPKRLGLAFYVYGGFLVFQPASFWRRDLYEKSGGIDPFFTFIMDPDLFTRFVINDAKFHLLDEFFVNFRLHESSKTASIQDVRKKEREELHLRYGGMVPFFLRNEFLMRKIGWLYQCKHIFSGNGKYFFNKLFERIGLSGQNMPY